MIEGLHHVQLAMPSGGEAEAVAFYEGVLGIPQVPKPANLAGRGGSWFETATVRIHLGVEAEFTPARKAHPAFVVTDPTGLRARLSNSGIATVEDQPLSGFDRFYAHDPFGNRLEFLSHLPSKHGLRQQPGD